MDVRTVALWALFGMACTGAGAMTLPLPKATSPSVGRDIQTDDGPSWNKDDTATAPGAHFNAGDTLAVDARLGHSSVGLRPNGRETYVFASITGANAPAAQAPPLNLAIVVDRSGSMMGMRIGNALAAATAAVEKMRDQDSVTVVSFDTQAKVVVAPTRVTSEARPGIMAAIRAIRLGGDTCISCGLETAMQQLETVSLGPDQVNRMILLSDGDPTDGVKDVPGFKTLAAGMRDRGFPITTIGVDVHYQEQVMEAIAQESNGHHYFVANPSGLAAIFNEEFDLLESSVASNAELVIEPAPGVRVEEVFERASRKEGTSTIVPLGAFAAKQEKTVLLRVKLSANDPGDRPVAHVALRYHDLLRREDARCTGDLALEVKDDGSEQKDLDPFVAARVERSHTAGALRTANDLFKKGRVEDARAALAKQEKELDRAKDEALANAAAAPAKTSGRALGTDFEEQRRDIAAAQASIAPTALPPVAAPQNTPQGKAAVRSNEVGDFRNGF